MATELKKAYLLWSKRLGFCSETIYVCIMIKYSSWSKQYHPLQILAVSHRKLILLNINILDIQCWNRRFNFMFNVLFLTIGALE